MCIRIRSVYVGSSYEVRRGPGQEVGCAALLRRTNQGPSEAPEDLVTLHSIILLTSLVLSKCLKLAVLPVSVPHV